MNTKRKVWKVRPSGLQTLRTMVSDSCDTTTPVKANQVNPCCNAIDFSTKVGFDTLIEVTKGLPNEQKHKGNSQETLSFIRVCQQEGAKCSFASLVQAMPQGTINVFENPGKLTW